MRADEDRSGRLSERERAVLQALIDAHIATTEPVASKAIAEIAELGVSPQTVRNVLAALHERGLIDQPHTSAGRVPTDRGLRYYVDSLLRWQAPSGAEQAEIEARIVDGGVDGALREASRVLTRLARYTTIVVQARPTAERIRHVELLRLRDDAVLLIAVTEEGRVQNRLLQWRGAAAEQAPDERTLERTSQRLDALLAGHTFAEARTALLAEASSHRAELDRLERKLLALSAEGLRASEPPQVLVDGTGHLLEDATDLEHTRELLHLLEEAERASELLERADAAPGIRIFIGDENPAALSERGVVVAPIGSGGALGTLGVIGPRHLDYARVVPLVDLTAQVVAKVLGRSGGGGG
ncbi:MAG: heat-inducible transcription repressor HrcA [Deltaproteobacteria bacterium]|nr:heat-inducible transcription repressor HrcA [Deltaproteobacteria bacterium]